MGLNEYIGKVTTGDCLDLMRELPDNYVDSVITDPPYGLSKHSKEDVAECLKSWLNGEPYDQNKKGFMGKEWDGWVPGPEVWKECYRVLKPGGTLLCFAGSRTQDLMGMALRLSGFELRDTICYHFGSGFPKSLDISKALDKQVGAEREVVGVQARKGRSCGILGKEVEIEHLTTLPSTELAKTFDGYGTALKPSVEFIIVAMKPCDGTFAQNAEKWGVAGLDIDAGRVAHNEECRMMKSQNGEAGNKVYAQSGRYEDTLELKPEGRWPANTILGCACEGEHEEDCPVRIMDEQSGVSKSGSYKGEGSKSGGIWGKSTGKPAGPEHGDSGGASRFFFQVKKDPIDDEVPARFLYCAKPSRAEKEAGLEGFEEGKISRMATKNGSSGVASKGMERFDTTNVKNTHATVKPISLMRYLCKLTRPPHGGIVLDPFTGSGTTGIAAILEDRDFIGFELSQEYADIANARIEHHRKLNIKDYDEEL